MISFNTKEHPFFDELKTRVDSYFDQNNISRTGNWMIYLKTAILLTSAVTFYSWLVFFTPGVWASLGLCAMLGLTLAGIGFNVMHDSAHGSYSKYDWINKVMGYSLNAMGGDVELWKIKHNLIHHSFTNVDEYDDDIDVKPFMRMSEIQPKKSFHKWQHIYGFGFYALNYLFWVFYFDFKKYFSRKIGSTPIRKFTLQDHIVFWLSKCVYMYLFFVLPMINIGVVSTIVGYTVLTVVTGIVIAIVFQLAHVVEATDFVNPKENNGLIQNEWAVHQIRTTSNFATHSKAVLWFTGGLNFQVEHHLFPRISHVHYPALNKIVKETCNKFGVTYNEHRTVLLAVRSHVNHLKYIGRN